MVQIARGEAKIIADLFKDPADSLTASFLQGHMGSAWADKLPEPSSARIIVGDFCSFAGAPCSELVKDLLPGSPVLLMVPPDEGWSRLIELLHSGRVEKINRYAVKKGPGAFDRRTLGSYIEKLPPEFHLSMIGEDLYNISKNEDWSSDLCALFPDYGSYEEHGIGVMALLGDTPVSGASSYAYYDDGIEIEIDTRSDYRRRGCALACASMLILECLDRGLNPCWDAHDLRSVALSEKLGYRLEREYVTYILRRDPPHADAQGQPE